MQDGVEKTQKISPENDERNVDKTIGMNSEIVSLKDYRTRDEYLYAMKEDLAEWIHSFYNIPITADEFFEYLENGVILCKHANAIQDAIVAYRHPDHQPIATPRQNSKKIIPYRVVLQKSGVQFKEKAQPGTFQSRDNLCNFISWCRGALAIPDSLLFETEDLVSRKNEKNVILCLLEVARRGSSFGMPAPRLVQYEEEIDAEIAADEAAAEDADVRQETHDIIQHEEQLSIPATTAEPQEKLTHLTKDNSKKQGNKTRPVIEVDMMSLDDMVRRILSRCTCPSQFPMVRVSEGKYKFGDSLSLIYLRILRHHVMVRIGGGWDTLEGFLDRHDPCRCNSKEHRGALAFVSKHNPTQDSSSLAVTAQFQRQHCVPSSSTCMSKENSCSASTSSIDSNNSCLQRDTQIARDCSIDSLVAMKDQQHPCSIKRQEGMDGTDTGIDETVNEMLVTSAETPVINPASVEPIPAAVVSKSQPCWQNSKSRAGERCRNSVECSASSEQNRMNGALSRSSNGNLAKVETNRRYSSNNDLRPKSTNSNSVRSDQGLINSSRNATDIVRSGNNAQQGNNRSRPSTPQGPSRRSRSVGSEGRRVPVSSTTTSQTMQHSMINNSPSSSANKQVVVMSKVGPQAAAKSKTESSSSTFQNKTKSLQQKFNNGKLGISPQNLLPNYQRKSIVHSSSADVLPEQNGNSLRRSGLLKLSASMSLLETLNDLPEAPPEDEDLNSRMELLFEEYRKVELGLIFNKSPDVATDTKTLNQNASDKICPKTANVSRSSRVRSASCDRGAIVKTKAYRRSPDIQVQQQKPLVTGNVHSTSVGCSSNPRCGTSRGRSRTRQESIPATSTAFVKSPDQEQNKSSNKTRLASARPSTGNATSDGRAKLSATVPTLSSKSNERCSSGLKIQGNSNDNLSNSSSKPFSRSLGNLSRMSSQIRPQSSSKPVQRAPSSLVLTQNSNQKESGRRSVPQVNYKTEIAQIKKVNPRKDERLGVRRTRIPMPCGARSLDETCSLKRFDSGVDITNASPTGDFLAHDPNELSDLWLQKKEPVHESKTLVQINSSPDKLLSKSAVVLNEQEYY